MCYKITLEIELESTSPLEAVKKFQGWVKDDSDLQYYVRDSNGTIYSVDLSEEDEDAVIEIDNYKPLIN